MYGKLLWHHLKWCWTCACNSMGKIVYLYVSVFVVDTRRDWVDIIYFEPNEMGKKRAHTHIHTHSSAHYIFFIQFQFFFSFALFSFCLLLLYLLSMFRFVFSIAVCFTIFLLFFLYVLHLMRSIWVDVYWFRARFIPLMVLFIHRFISIQLFFFPLSKKMAYYADISITLYTCSYYTVNRSRHRHCRRFYAYSYS